MYRKNTAGQFVGIGLIKAADGTALAGATIACRRCIDGTFAAGGGTVTEDSAGLYKYAMAQADTNGNDVTLYFTATSAIPITVNFITTAADPTDGVRFGLTALPNAAASAIGGLPLAVDTSGRVDVLKVNGTSQTAKDLGASATQTGDSYARLGAPAGASQAADIAAVKSDTGANRTALGTAGAGLTALGDTRIANLDAAVSTRLATSGYTAPSNASIAAVKTQTDKLAFTIAGQVDANIQSVNDVTVNGNGQAGTQWGP